MVLVCGVEEAGRGPVIGPLVMCGVLIEQEDEAKLQEMGVKDSKLLSPKQRSNLFNKIKKIAKSSKLLVVSPKEVDDALNSESLNLNKLEAQKMAEIINKLKPDRAIIDCPSINIPAFAGYLRKFIENKNIEIIAEHKADTKYFVVGAASILAKVVRDKEIEKIKRKIGINFGSGYPSDEITQDFLGKYWDKYPGIFRKTWISYKKIVKKQNQKNLGEF